ncbi:MAG TPA: hypothetical protein VMT37_09210 [Solirubrobacterales bacterium]|nr:hypothetical protein [Thermoleophilia bacterium]HVO54579.1 hypothetical protein [Solirubrobacterales bacterium]
MFIAPVAAPPPLAAAGAVDGALDDGTGRRAVTGRRRRIRSGVR